MAACAHVWHYKCIRRVIHSPDYPMFQCPNCRAWTDLSADVDDTIDLEDESHAEDNTSPRQDASGEANGEANTTNQDNNSAAEEPPSVDTRRIETGTQDRDLAAAAENLQLEERRNTPLQDTENPDGPASGNGHSANIPIPVGPSSRTNKQSDSRSGTPANPETLEDDPMTPRNDTGPLALDGRAGHL